MCTLYLVLINSPFSTALLLLLVLFTLCLTVSAITGCGIWPIYTMQFFRLLSRGKILKLEPGILMFTFVSSTADYFQVLRTLVLFCNAFLSHISPNVNNANKFRENENYSFINMIRQYLVFRLQNLTLHCHYESAVWTEPKKHFFRLITFNKIPDNHLTLIPTIGTKKKKQSLYFVNDGHPYIMNLDFTIPFQLVCVNYSLARRRHWNPIWTKQILMYWLWFSLESRTFRLRPLISHNHE